jgi:thioredoxin-related protein
MYITKKKKFNKKEVRNAAEAHIALITLCIQNSTNVTQENQHLQSSASM